MKYISTRGKETGLTFEQVLFSGYASDGGLYFPETIPVLSTSFLHLNWNELAYPDLVKVILELYIDKEEIPQRHIHELVDKAFSKFSQFPVEDKASIESQLFPEKVVRVAHLSNGLNIAELFHGPTLAFKDLALTIVGEFYNYFLKKRQEHRTILVGTSGDTGSSAIAAVKGSEMMDIIVLLPKGRCTEIQELQMTTVQEKNVHVFAVEGTSDDLDIPIKKIFADAAYVEKHHLCSINSINWARILIQVAHFIYCYFRCRTDPTSPVRIIVPTGACGNITAGYIAKLMGFPIELVACVNPNDIVHRTFAFGDFSMKSDPVKPTWAPAMDIQMPYNVERILLMASQFDVEKVAKLMTIFEANDGVTVPPEILEVIKSVIVDTKCVNDVEILDTIFKCSEANAGYEICPHTAVGVKYYMDSRDKGKLPHVCIATASAAKFPEALRKAGLKPDLPPTIAQLFTLPVKYEWMKKGQNWEEMLRQKINEIDTHIDAHK